MSPPVRLERDGALARVVLARPPLNVLDLDTLARLPRSGPRASNPRWPAVGA